MRSTEVRCFVDIFRIYTNEKMGGGGTIGYYIRTKWIYFCVKIHIYSKWRTFGVVYEKGRARNSCLKKLFLYFIIHPIKNTKHEGLNGREFNTEENKL